MESSVIINDLMPLFISFILVGIPVICYTLIKITRILRGDEVSKTSRLGGSEPEEARLLQEMQKSLGRMETRIEALETIILDRERQKKAGL